MLMVAGTPIASVAQPGFNAKVDSTFSRSPAARSALAARAILEQAISASGGLQALRSISSISTDRSLHRTTPGQGMHPGAPAVGPGILLTRLDLRARRAFSLRDAVIDGGQFLATVTIVTPDSGFDVFYQSHAYYSRGFAQSQYGTVRVALLRGELPTLLLAAWNRPEQLLSTGRAVIQGRACDGIAFADADGSLVTLYFDAVTHLLARSEFLADDPTRGDVAASTDYSDYRPVNGVQLPFRTLQSGPGPDRWDATITRAEFNDPLADSLFVVPKGLDPLPPQAAIRKLAEGVYALQGALAVEFNDFVVVFEAYGDGRRSAVNIARLRSVIPSKPIRYVISSHYHQDHLGGVREYAALGAGFITTRDAVERLRDNLLVRHAMRPDGFSAAPRNPAIEIVDSVRVIEDGTRRLELYQIGPTAHVDRILIGYLPRERILVEGDLLDMTGGNPVAGGEDTEQFAKKIAELRLDVAVLVPIHGSPGTGTMQDLDRAVAMHRALAKCSQELVARLFCGFWQAPAFDPFPGGIGAKYHFDLARNFFRSPAEAETERQRVVARVGGLSDWALRMPETGAGLLAALATEDSLTAQVQRHLMYLDLAYHADTRNAEAQRAAGVFGAAVGPAFAAFNRALAALPDASLDRLEATTPALRRYRYSIERQRAETRLAPIPPGGGPQRFTQLLASIDFGTVQTAAGPRSVSRDYEALSADADPRVRREVYERNQEGLAKMREGMAAILSETATELNAGARSRGFPDYVTRSYAERQLDRVQVRRMFAALADAAGLNQEIERTINAHRRAVFRLDTVHVWDQNVVEPGAPLPEFTIVEATRLALDATRPLGADYTRELGLLLDPAHGRLDIAPAPNRSNRQGFSDGFVEFPSMFYQGAFGGRPEDLITLVHESGHAVQNMLMTANHVPARYASGPGYFTESFAGFSELLLLEHLYRTAPDRPRRIYFLQRLINQGADVFRLGWEAALEEQIFDSTAAGRSLGADAIEAMTQVTASRFSTWFGPGSERKLAWMQPTQFFTRPLYRLNYVYARLLALRYLDMFHADPAGFPARYAALLRNGYDAPPDALLTRFIGTGVADPELVLGAKRVLSAYLDELKTLYAR